MIKSLLFAFGLSFINVITVVAGDSGAALFTGFDRVTQGDWRGRYGNFVYILCAAREYHLVGGSGWPLEVRFESGEPARSAARFINTLRSDESRALWNPFHGSGALAAVTAAPTDLRLVATHRRNSAADPSEIERAYSGLGRDLTIRVSLPQGAFRLAFYLVDGLVDGQTRPSHVRVRLEGAQESEAVDVTDFRSGVYVNFKAHGPGEARARIELVDGLWATLSGLFIDAEPAPSAAKSAALAKRQAGMRGSDSAPPTYERALGDWRRGHDQAAVEGLLRLAPQSPEGLLARQWLASEFGPAGRTRVAPFGMSARQMERLPLAAFLRAHLRWYFPHWSRAQIEKFSTAITSEVASWNAERRAILRAHFPQWIKRLSPLRPESAAWELALEESRWSLKSFAASFRADAGAGSEMWLENLLAKARECATKLEGLAQGQLEAFHKGALAQARAERASPFIFVSRRALDQEEGGKLLEAWRPIADLEIQTANLAVKQIPDNIAQERRVKLIRSLTNDAIERIYGRLLAFTGRVLSQPAPDSVRRLRELAGAERKEQESRFRNAESALAWRLSQKALLQDELIMWMWYPLRSLVGRSAGSLERWRDSMPFNRGLATGSVTLAPDGGGPAAYRVRLIVGGRSRVKSAGAIRSDPLASLQIIERMAKETSPDFLRECVGSTWQLFADRARSYHSFTEMTEVTTSSEANIPIRLMGGFFRAEEITPWLLRFWDPDRGEFAPGRAASSLADYHWEAWRPLPGGIRVPTRLRATFRQVEVAAQATLDPFAAAFPIPLAEPSGSISQVILPLAERQAVLQFQLVGRRHLMPSTLSLYDERKRLILHLRFDKWRIE